MVSLYRDPNGEKIFTDQHPATISMDMAIPGGHGKPKEQGNQSKAVIIDGNQSNGLAVKNNQSDGQLTRNESDKQPLKVSQTGATKGKELKEEPKKVSFTCMMVM